MANIINRGDALAKAQALADRIQRAVDVYQHVGLYGQPGGDIEARHHFRLRWGKTTLGDDFALVAIAHPRPLTNPAKPN